MQGKEVQQLTLSIDPRRKISLAGCQGFDFVGHLTVEEARGVLAPGEDGAGVCESAGFGVTPSESSKETRFPDGAGEIESI